MKRIEIWMAVMIASLLFLVVSGCTVPQVTQAPDGTTSTNYVVDPRFETGILTGRAVNTATAPVNPYSPIVEIGLGAAAAIAAWFAKRKNDQASGSMAQLKTVIQAVDALDDVKIKEAIQAHAVRVGTETELSKTVKGVGSGLI